MRSTSVGERRAGQNGSDRAPPLRYAAAKGVLVAAIAMAMGVGVTRARAQDRGAVFAGGSFDEDDSGYIGAQAALPGSRPGSGWAVRGAVTGGVYSYDRGGRGIDARFVGGQLGGVYQWSGAWGYFDVGLQGRYVDTHLSPYDVENPRRGGIADALVSIDGAHRWGAWRAVGYGEYGTGVEDYYVRANVTHDLTARLRAGIETIIQGDPTYDRQRFGPVFAAKVTPVDEIQLSGGLSRQSSRSDHAYVSLAYVRGF